MMHQKLVLFLGLILSVLLHGAVFYALNDTKQVDSAKTPKPTVTKVTLCAPLPKEPKQEPKIAPKPKQEAKPKVKQKPKKKPKPKVKPKPKKVKPEPKPKKVKPKPKPKIEKKKIEPIPEPKKETVPEIVEEEVIEEVQEEIVEETPPVTTQQIAQSQVNFEELDARKNIFLKELRTAIDNNKIYPRIARRRGMQGEVSIVFNVLANGELTNINILDGKKVFHNAVKQAIEKSSPRLDSPEGLTYPLKVNLKISFKLR